MSRKWLSIIALITTASSLLVVSSCGDPQELVSIEVQPGTETFGTTSTPVPSLAGAQVQLRALGSYVHPPVTKDITNQVTWASNTPQMVTVNSTGLITVTGEACGGTLVSATVTTNHDGSGLSSSGAVVTGFMTADVTCQTTTNGGGSGGEEALTLTFAGNGSGTVASSPLGLSCSSACLGQFTNGTTVTLTATATGGSQFTSWVGCDTPGTTNPCMVTMTGNRTVTVSFN